MDSLKYKNLEKICFDFTQIFPFKSAGVENVAISLLIQCIRQNNYPTILVSHGYMESWKARLELEDLVVGIDYEIDACWTGITKPKNQTNLALGLRMRTTSKVKSKFSNSLFMYILITKLRIITKKIYFKKKGTKIVFLPFHRSPVAHKNTLMNLHDLRGFQASFLNRNDIWIVSRNVAHAKLIFCTWRHPASQLLEMFPDSASKVTVINHPSMTETDSRESHLTASPISKKSTNLLYVASMTIHKNHQVLLKALSLGRDLNLWLVGPETEKIKSELIELGTMLGVMNQITFFGYVSKEKLNELYSFADYVVIPSRWEAASGVVIESIARNKPTIVSDTEPLLFQIEDLGLFTRPFKWNSAEDLITSIEWTKANISPVMDSVEKARLLIESITWKRVWLQMLRVYSNKVNDSQN